MYANTNTQKRPLKRYFDVNFSEKEANKLKQYTTEKPGVGFLNGEPCLIRKRNGEYIAKIFRRLGITDGTSTAIGKIKFIGSRNVEVVIKSGGLGIGYFMSAVCLIFTIALVVFLFLPGIVEELELNLFAFVFAIPVFGVMGWLFLSRKMRESDLEQLESYLREKIGGEWSER